MPAASRIGTALDTVSGMQAEPRPAALATGLAPAPELEIDCNRSAVRASEVRALFARNAQSAPRAAYDRDYSLALAAGGMSWVVQSTDGEVVGHLAGVPREFAGVGRRALAAQLCDILLDPPYRSFWHAVELVRCAMTDLAEAGFGFAYATPAPLAQPTLSAVGFRRLGALGRFVMPLSPPYTGLFRLVTRAPPLRVETGRAVPAASWAESLLRGCPRDLFCARRTGQFYGTQLDGVLDARCLTVWRAQDGVSSGASAIALVGPAADGDATTLDVKDVRWDDARVSPEAVIASVAVAARRGGYRKLGVVALAESEFASGLRRAGLSQRGEWSPVVVRDLGGGLPDIVSWLLTGCDGNAWC